MNLLPPPAVNIAEEIAQQLEDVLIKHFHGIANSHDDNEQDEATELSEVAHMVRFQIAMTYIHQQLQEHEELFKATPVTENLHEQFGLVCSRSFLNSAFSEFLLAIQDKEYKDSKQRLTVLINHMSSVKFAEQDILNSMGGRVEFVESLKTSFLAVNIFGLKDLPEEILSII